VPRNSEEILTDAPPRAADERIAYGPEPKQFGDLRLPAGDRLAPLAVVIHGGYWQATYNLIHTGHMCEALREAGIATWNIEYRCRGDVGGVWPGAADDAAAAVEFVDELIERHPLDRERIVLVGHSAGGQLAFFAAGRARLPVVALAAVSNLRDSAERTGPNGPVARFMGGMPSELDERYSEASPLELLPVGVRQILLHGDADSDVPYAQSVAYAEAAGHEAELIALPGTGHFELIDPQAREWPRTLGAIQALL
jgi:acetyl esterase/lipase